MDVNLPVPRLPEPPAAYTREAEAQFRAELQRWIQDVVVAVRAMAAEIVA